MRHEWVFDVLSDLLAFATRNDLPRLAARVAEALEEARVELASVKDGQDEAPRVPSSGRSVH